MKYSTSSGIGSWAGSTSLSLLLLAFGGMGFELRGDGPADNSAATVRRVPPAGITLPDSIRDELRSGVEKLGQSIEVSRSQWAKDSRQLRRLADIEIFHKAVDWAVRYGEMFKTNEVESARLQL
ncbi:MAG: hypothetical protein RLZZ34_2000, partial [Verrucomicrobiota bacterium]